MAVVRSPTSSAPSPDFSRGASPHGIIVTANATGVGDGFDADHDVVSLYFAPGIGIDETR